MRSEKMRRVNSWHELRDGATSVIFYYNDDTGHYQLNKSEPVLEREEKASLDSCQKAETRRLG